MIHTTRQAYGRSWSPKADIFETDEGLILQLDIAGVDPDQIDIQCEKGVLTIRGERPFSPELSKQQYHRIENMYGPFERYFELPRTIDMTDVDATYHDGVLTVSFPKKKEAKPQKISINVT